VADLDPLFQLNWRRTKGIFDMKNPIYEFLRSVDEGNRANIMALRYAESILEDFKNLSPGGRKIMADTLMDLISQKKKNSDVEP
jgi:hypothetical protein